MRAQAVILALLIAAMLPGSAMARPAQNMVAVEPGTTMLDRRIPQLAPLFTGGGDYAAVFTEQFRAQVPEPHWRALAAQVVAAIGAPTGVEEVTPAGPHGATLRYGFERGIATIRIAVEPTGAGRISGLLITHTEPRGDSAERVTADIAALPGQAGLAVWRLDGVRPQAMFGHAADRAGPVGSAFKLWVLAEAARQITLGQRRWGDVVRLGDRSLPSGVTQNWPRQSPLTLHTLAIQMISISDNSATDTLMTTLGRARVDAVLATIGVSDPARSQPVLTTLEAFRLKSLARQGGLAERWDDMTPDARRRLLADRAAAIGAAPVASTLFSDGPLRTDIEWVASPSDMARTLDWLRREGGTEARAILGINPGTGIADRFAWVGFKGGSEPGVVSLNYLVETKSGAWFAVSGQWHDPAGGVDEARLAAIMNRALTLVSRPARP